MIKRILKRIFTERQRIKLRYGFFSLRGFFYRGGSFYCNYCDRSYRTFLPYGFVPRENAACPACISLERTRLLKVFLERETRAFDPETRILHFGPERMLERVLKKVHLPGTYFSSDINPALADHVVDIGCIPFQDGHFDVVICSHILAYVEDEEAAVNEMFRVLKPGGMALVLTLLDRSRPESAEKYELAADSRLEPGMLRLHGGDFPGRLERRGMHIQEVDYAERLSARERKQLSVGDGSRELIFVCTKGNPGRVHGSLTIPGETPS